MLIYRYLTKICDQVVAMLSAEHTARIIWGDETDGRLFTFEVARLNEQEESASSRPGFQVIIAPLSGTKSTADLPKLNSRLISSHVVPTCCPVDPSIFVPSLLHGETAQGFWTVSYVPPTARISSLDHRSYSQLYLRRLLYVLRICPRHSVHSILVRIIP